MERLKGAMATLIFFGIGAAALTLFGIGAAAQGTLVPRKTAPLGVMGKPVKGAPYSADEITESLQVLADGTRISHQSQVTVYRDGEGRVRRESPAQITIYDPVENVNYLLDPKTMTAVKSPLARTFSFTSAQSPEKTYFFVGDATGADSETAAKAKADAAAQLNSARLDKLKAELAASENAMIVNGNPASPQTVLMLKGQLDQAMEKVSATGAASPAKTEALGQQTIEGLTADGTRTTSTIEAGSIGNDRPIQIVSERWYSAELQTQVMTKHSDPRTGEESFRLVHVRRGEPGADLFLLPPGYQLATQTPDVFFTRKEE